MTPHDELLSRVLHTLGNGKTLLREELTVLSHLTPEDLELLRQRWEQLDSVGRRRLLGQLHESERQTARHDFNAIYQLGFDDPDPVVRQEAIHSIVEDSSPKLMERLVAMATSDQDVMVREAAVSALSPFVLKAELQELPAEQAQLLQETLLGVLHREGEGVGPRSEALAALGYVDSELVAGEIRRAYLDRALKLAAVRAMGRAANVIWLPTLAQEAASDDSLMRVEAARACGEMADQRATAIVADMVDDPELEVRLAAIAALGQIGGEEAREALLYALEDKRNVIRQAAEAALSDLELDEDPLAL